MTDGLLAKWHKKVGDQVKTGDLVAEIETDKATMDFESFQEGTLLYIGPKEGESVPVDGIIAILGKAGEDYKALLNGGAEPAAVEAAPVAAAPAVVPAAPAVVSAAPVAVPVHVPAETIAQILDSRIKASPLARKLAEEKGVNLKDVSGSTENGRIVKKDIEAFVSAAAPALVASVPQPVAAPVAVPGAYDEIAVSPMRRVIAKRLAESKFSAPHFYLTMSIRMDKAMELRKQLNEISAVKISFNDLVLKAVAMAIKTNPKVNSSWLGDKIRYNHVVNIGVAVAVDEGLLVPVVRNADSKSLSQISSEVKEFAQKAKDKKLQPSDWEGSTFTISNLGMYGIDEFTAIINPPDACILAIGGIQSVPVVENNQVVPGNVMKVTLSCDHRVVDGAIGSAFLQSLKELLELPFRILI